VPFASIESVAQVPPFFMSRYEVTNAEFKEFVDSGGYERRSLWDGLDMRQGSKPLAFGEAMRLFVDSTGRQGPSTWELGTYPEGRGKYPVSGVSWYEAVAYSRFRGMSLPTFFHWLRAALPESELPTSLAASIAPRSNFGTSGPVPGGQYQGVGLYGTYDLYGNVREWLANPGAKGGWLIGGSWEDPDYQYSSTVPTLLLERSRLNGFRLVKNQGDAPNAATLTAALDLLINSSSKVAPKPVSDEVYADYKRQFAYVPGVLHETQPVTMSSNEDWIKQRVTIDAGYNGERLDVIMFLPKRARPPYQPIVFFSGGGAVAFPLKSEDIEPGFAGMPLDYVVKSGRVLVQPIIQGSYERFKSANDPNDRVRDLREWIERRWDIGRTLDYLATRSDIDAARAGFMGLSFGASAALPLVAVESRLKAAVLISGGMPPPGGPLTSQIPLMDVSSHAARIRIPVLMINGRYDEVFPLETAQQSLFRVLGTAPADKRHVVLDFGHGSPPRAETLRETLGWFDKYLGEVRQ
jgi:dienelactone hydrolase